MKIASFIVGTAFVAAFFSANAGDVTGIRYSSPDRCLLDLRIPEKGGPCPVVVWFHGGGLEHGNRHFVPINGPIVQVAVGYRLFGNGASSGADCIEDAAAAVAWTFRNIASYGGDTNRIFVAGMSAGGYLTMMVGMAPKYLARHGIANTPIAGLVPLSDQATKHFNVRKFSGDKDAQFYPKIDELAPLAWVGKDLPPILSVCGQPPYEWKCRSEENRFLIASCTALGHKKARFVEVPFCNHGRAYTAGLPYLEMLVLGKLSDVNSF
jgi:acetyl esterase/lipase